MRRIIGTLIAVLLLSASQAIALRAQQSADEKSQPAAAAAAQTAAERQAAPERPATEARNPAAPADPSGSWKWDYTTPDDNKLEFMLKLKWDGKQLGGKYTSFNNTIDIEAPKLEKDMVSFVVRPEFNGARMEVKFNGKVVNDEIKGTIGLNFGGEPQDIEWTAKRFVDVDDVLGEWALKVEGPDGNEFESKLTVSKDDKGLHAKTTSDFGEFAAKTVEIKDNQLIFELASDNADFAFKIVYRGAPRGDSIEGKSEFDFGGNTGEMKFTGKRLPPKEDKKIEPARPTGQASDGKATATDADKKQSTQPASAATKSDDK